MKLIENIKDYFGNRKLLKLLVNNKKRSVCFCNLNQAKSVGIIASIKKEDDYLKIMKFVNYLKGEIGVREVSAMAFYSEKEEPTYLKKKITFDYFTINDLSWNRNPIKDSCIHFTNQEFDILIDLSDEFIIPLRMLLAQSKSKFKVGKYSKENEAYYDFMINAEHNNFHQFTTEAVRYLTVING